MILICIKNYPIIFWNRFRYQTHSSIWSCALWAKSFNDLHAFDFIGVNLWSSISQICQRRYPLFVIHLWPNEDKVTQIICWIGKFWSSAYWGKFFDILPYYGIFKYKVFCLYHLCENSGPRWLNWLRKWYYTLWKAI